MKIVFALVPIALLFNVILGYPHGAPSKACILISPDPIKHGAPPQRSRSPFILTIRGNPTEYVPGQQYTLILSARKHKRRFRGFLVVSQNSNKDQVGSFTAGKGQHQACSDRSGITHSNRHKKKSVTLTWTAPPEGTGAVVFKYAVVSSRRIYWANQQGPILQERSVTSTTAVEPSSKAPLTSSALPSSKIPLTSSALPSSKIPLTSSTLSSSKVPLISSSASISTTSSVAVTSSEVGTSTLSPTPSATIATSTTTGEATSTGPAPSTSVEPSSRRTSSVAIVTLSVAPIATPSVAPIATLSVAPIATPSVAPSATPSVAPSATPSVAPSATPTPSTSTSAPIVTVPGTDGNVSRGSTSFAGMVTTAVFLIIGFVAMMI